MAKQKDLDAARGALYEAEQRVQFSRAMVRLMARAVTRGDRVVAESLAYGLLAEGEAVGASWREVDGVQVADGWYATALAAGCLETIRARAPGDPGNGPYNYTEFKIRAPDMELVVHVQRVDGKTPVELVTEARAETAELRKLHDAALADNARLRELLALHETPRDA